MYKENIVYIIWNIIHPLKKKETLPFATIWYNLEGTIGRDISQTEENKKKKMNSGMEFRKVISKEWKKYKLVKRINCH